MPNFAASREPDVVLADGESREVNATLYLTMSADVLVTGQRTFRNIADLDAPEGGLIGIADSASEGLVTGRQIDARPIMRAGEILETVPGVVISQHSGEGKANQYYLRGFNLDHGTDFATTVAGVPVNMPTHAHGHGYSDLNFLIPELVGGVQFRKGPYFADEGDFSSAGSSHVRYLNVLDAPIVRVGGGEDGWGRALAAASPRVGPGHLLVAVEANHNDGPWVNGDNYEKLNGVVRYTTGDARNGLSVTAMGYDGTWSATDQAPLRAVDAGLISRFDSIDDSVGGDTFRFSLSSEWQQTRSASVTRASAYVMRYTLDLFSNANAGYGYHSNDARGTTITADPASGDGVDRVTPLARARGAELGARFVPMRGVETDIALWRLDLDSELLFIGDAGTTEASRPSRRWGVEWKTYLAPRSWLILDADLGWSSARFRDDDPAGNRIPGSVERVMSAGITLDDGQRAFGSVRLRYFGGRNLVEDGSIRSSPTRLVNAQTGYRVSSRAALVLDAFNLFDARASDIDYFYASRLPGEPSAGVEDLHSHPTLPRTLRASLRLSF